MPLLHGVLYLTWEYYKNAMLDIILEVNGQHYNLSPTWDLESYGLRPTSSIVTNGSAGQLGSIINERRYIVVVVRGEFPQKEFSCAINESH